MKLIVHIPLKSILLLLFFTTSLASCYKESAVKPVQYKSVSYFKSPPLVDPFAGINHQQIESLLSTMTLEEKIGQLIIWTPDLEDTEDLLIASSWIHQGKIGGFLPKPATIEDYLYWKDSLTAAATIPLLLGTNENVALHNQFKGLARFPAASTIAAIDSNDVHRTLESHFFDQCKALNIQFGMVDGLPSAYDSTLHTPDQVLFQKELLASRIERLTNQQMIAVVDQFSMEHIEPNDSIRLTRLHEVFQLCSAGLPALLLSDDIFSDERIRRAPFGFLQQYLQEKMGFHGLAMTRLLEGESPELKLLQGAELCLTDDIELFHLYALNMIREGLMSEKELDRRVRKVLSAKAWINGGQINIPDSRLAQDSIQRPVRLASFVERSNPSNRRPKNIPLKHKVVLDQHITDYFKDPAWHLYTKKLHQLAITCPSDVNRLLPFKKLLGKEFQLIGFSERPFINFQKNFEKYANCKAQYYQWDLQPEGSFPTSVTDLQKVAVILLDKVSLSIQKDSSFIQRIHRMNEEMPVVLVNFGQAQNLQFFQNSITLLQVYERNEWTEKIAAQALFGGIDVKGKLPIKVGPELKLGASEYIYKDRVGFHMPEAAGIAPERLVGIDAIANAAIRNKVFPGCQVAVIKEGQVVYSKAFGYHTYNKQRAVSTTDLYDVASVSKIAATTLAIMKLAEQNRIVINGLVSDYAKLARDATVGKLRLKELLIHNSGLLPAMPISKYYSYRSVPSNGCNDIFCTNKMDSFEVEITPSLYFKKNFQDSIWRKVGRSTITRRNRFRYSDVNFYLLQRVAEDVSHQTLDQLVNDQFYHSIGLRRLLYNPAQKFDRSQIVPTEKDYVWRKDLIDGNVHDPAAALMGGVGGNAGIFSNAEDMAVLFQMMANHGVYGSIQYFDSKTIETFTTPKHGNHRGLGFDKPANRKYPTHSLKASPSTYGHSGFTGTCVWVDPESDLVYVFLSNRIHPSAKNKKIFSEGIRRRIHDVVYDSFDSFDGTLPSLKDND